MSSLFAKLGGRDAVTAAVDKFYEKVLADESLAPFFEGRNMMKQRSMLMQFMTFAFGGPEGYKGKDLYTAHKHLNIKEEHFDAVAGHFVSTLQELGVAQELIDEAFTVVASTKDQVLGLAPPPSA